MSAQLANVVSLLHEPAARGLILHVDDDQDMRQSTALLLRASGFETREAVSGEHALSQVDTLRGRLDVLIVDYNLGPGMTGTELAEEFARLLGHAVPTVVLTDAPVWVARKPLHPDTLLAALPPLVDFRRAVAAAAAR